MVSSQPEHASNSQPPGLWQGQALHFGCVAVLLVLVAQAWNSIGQPAPLLFWLAVALPVVHQIIVWLVWRLTLGSPAGEGPLTLRAYVVLFFIFFGGRFVTLFALAWVDRGSLGLPLAPRWLLTTLLLAVGLYAMYSVKRYFGLIRAAGADHFDPAYREMPLVSDGIFRFTSNGMYLYAFMLFWAIAVGLNSQAALIVAAFSHVYIWVHYYATEKPDMNYLCGPHSEAETG